MKAFGKNFGYKVEIRQAHTWYLHIVFEKGLPHIFVLPSILQGWMLCIPTLQTRKPSLGVITWLSQGHGAIKWRSQGPWFQCPFHYTTPSPVSHSSLPEEEAAPEMKRSQLLDKSIHQVFLTASHSKFDFHIQCPYLLLPGVKNGTFLSGKATQRVLPLTCTISMQSSGGPRRAQAANQKRYIVLLF